MNVPQILAIIAGGLAIGSFFKPTYPLLSVACLLLAIAFFITK